MAVPQTSEDRRRGFGTTRPLGGTYFTSEESVEILPIGKNAISRRHVRETGIASNDAAGPVAVARRRGPRFYPKLAVALSRPPGHHASRHVADGFCLYNFAAGAAAYALDVLDKDWVALLDFDVHHGNGVAAYADEEARVMYASAHQAPLWPNTGDDPSDTGMLGNRLNACVKRGADAASSAAPGTAV